MYMYHMHWLSIYIYYMYMYIFINLHVLLYHIHIGQSTISKLNLQDIDQIINICITRSSEISYIHS